MDIVLFLMHISIKQTRWVKTCEIMFRLSRRDTTTVNCQLSIVNCQLSTEKFFPSPLAKWE